MDMNIKYQLQGMLAEKKNKIDVLEIKADRLCKDITMGVFSDDGIKGVNFSLAKQAMDDLGKVIEDYEQLTKEIKKIQAEI